MDFPFSHHIISLWHGAEKHMVLINTSRPSNAYHSCISELSNHLFSLSLAAFVAPIYYLNKCWLFVNWTVRNIFQLMFSQSMKHFIPVISNMSSAKWWPFWPHLNVLRISRNIDPAKFWIEVVRSLWNNAGASTSLLPRSLPDFSVIGKL